MGRDLNGYVVFDVSSDFFSSSFSDKRAKSADVDILIFLKRCFNLRKKCLHRDQDVHLGTPVFSAMMLTKSAFLITLIYSKLR